jgi:hypothetical protein
VGPLEGVNSAVIITGPLDFTFTDAGNRAGAAVVVGALLTICGTAAEVLVALLFESPLYSPEIECIPAVRLEVENVAVPELEFMAFTGENPKGVPLS